MEVPRTTSTDKPSTSTVIQRRPLQQIFQDNPLIAWQVLQSESLIHINPEVTMDLITHLSALYMRIIQKLNSYQDPRESYFSLKMQKLMSQPYVIRCFTSQHEKKKNILDSKRKQLQQKIEQEAEKHNYRKVVEQVLLAQDQKQKKIKDKINELCSQHDKQLQDRIRKRTQMNGSKLLGISPIKIQSSISEELGGRTNDSSSPLMRTDRLFGRGYRSSSQLDESAEQEDLNFRVMRWQIQQEEQAERMKRKNI